MPSLCFDVELPSLLFLRSLFKLWDLTARLLWHIMKYTNIMLGVLLLCTGVPIDTFINHYADGTLATISQISGVPAINITGVVSPLNNRQGRRLSAGSTSSSNSYVFYKLYTTNGTSVKLRIRTSCQLNGKGFYSVLQRNGVNLRPQIILSREVLASGEAAPASPAPPTGPLSQWWVALIVLGTVFATVVIGITFCCCCCCAYRARQARKMIKEVLDDEEEKAKASEHRCSCSCWPEGLARPDCSDDDTDAARDGNCGSGNGNTVHLRDGGSFWRTYDGTAINPVYQTSPRLDHTPRPPTSARLAMVPQLPLALGGEIQRLGPAAAAGAAAHACLPRIRTTICAAAAAPPAPSSTAASSVENPRGRFGGAFDTGLMFNFLRRTNSCSSSTAGSMVRGSDSGASMSQSVKSGWTLPSPVKKILSSNCFEGPIVRNSGAVSSRYTITSVCGRPPTSTTASPFAAAAAGAAGAGAGTHLVELDTPVSSDAGSFFPAPIPAVTPLAARNSRGAGSASTAVLPTNAGSSTARTTASAAGPRLCPSMERDPRMESLRDSCSSWAATVTSPRSHTATATAVTADVAPSDPAGVTGVGHPGPIVPPLPLPSAAAAAARAAGVAQRLDSSGSLMLYLRGSQPPPVDAPVTPVGDRSPARARRLLSNPFSGTGLLGSITGASGTGVSVSGSSFVSALTAPPSPPTDAAPCASSPISFSHGNRAMQGAVTPTLDFMGAESVLPKSTVTCSPIQSASDASPVRVGSSTSLGGGGKPPAVPSRLILTPPPPPAGRASGRGAGTAASAAAQSSSLASSSTKGTHSRASSISKANSMDLIRSLRIAPDQSPKSVSSNGGNARGLRGLDGRGERPEVGIAHVGFPRRSAASNGGGMGSDAKRYTEKYTQEINRQISLQAAQHQQQQQRRLWLTGNTQAQERGLNALKEALELQNLQRQRRISSESDFSGVQSNGTEWTGSEVGSFAPTVIHPAVAWGVNLKHHNGGVRSTELHAEDEREIQGRDQEPSSAHQQQQERLPQYVYQQRKPPLPNMQHHQQQRQGQHEPVKVQLPVRVGVAVSPRGSECSLAQEVELARAGHANGVEPAGGDSNAAGGGFSSVQAAAKRYLGYLGYAS